MLLCKNHLSVSRFIPLLSAENKLFKFISVDVFANKNCLRFTCFYIPPSAVGSYNDFYYACKCLSDCHTTCSPHFVCGDFNLPNFDWSIPVSVGDSAHDYFVELCNDLNLVQHVYPPIIAATFLVFFCATLIAHPHSYPLRFVLLSRTLVIILLSHLRFSFLLLLVSMYTCPISNPQTVLLSVMNCPVRNEMLLSLAAIITFNFMMPLLTKSIYRLVTMFHLNLSILSLLSPTMFGNYLKKRKDFTRSTTDKAAYKEVSKNYDQAMKLWCDKIENAICESPNSAKFYGFAKNKLKSHACIPPLQSDDDTLAETDVEKANLLNLTFQKVFRIDDGQNLCLNCSVVPEN